MKPLERTNADILRTIHALEWLGNQSPGKNTKASSYNAFQLRVQLHLEAYRPLGTAIGHIQKSLFQQFENAAGTETRYLENGNISFGLTADREYIRQSDMLLEARADEEPLRKPFQMGDFEASDIFVPQVILGELGPLFQRPDKFDPDSK